MYSANSFWWSPEMCCEPTVPVLVTLSELLPFSLVMTSISLHLFCNNTEVVSVFHLTKCLTEEGSNMIIYTF